MEMYAVTYFAFISLHNGDKGDVYTSGFHLAVNEAYALKGAMDECRRIFPKEGNEKFAMCWGHQVSLFRVSEEEPIYVNGEPYYVQVHKGAEVEDA